MKQILRQLDNIIVRLKLEESLEKVKFIREYGSHTAQVPLFVGFMAVVSVMDTSLSKQYIGGYMSSAVKGEEFQAKVAISVYAPADENGNGLSEITSEMLAALRKVDSEKILGEFTVSPIEFDADMNAIFRTVEFKMDFYLCEEA